MITVMPLQTEILAQIDAVLSKHRELRSRSQYDDCSDLPDVEVTGQTALMCETIRRLAPHNSQYIESMKSILSKFGIENAYVVPHIAGILVALRAAYDAGYLLNVAELIHADVFADFVEMADYLLSEGYKDPAAVVIGSTLEEHLRQLCGKHGIAPDVAGKPKKADQLNADLAGQSVYSKLDQKSITAWLDLRNKAAHGKYSEYSKEQVAFVVQGVRDFMARVPA
jgi:hypothetical protein